MRSYKRIQLLMDTESNLKCVKIAGYYNSENSLAYQQHKPLTIGYYFKCEYMMNLCLTNIILATVGEIFISLYVYKSPSFSF